MQVSARRNTEGRAESWYDLTTEEADLLKGLELWSTFIESLAKYEVVLIDGKEVARGKSRY